MTGDAEDHLRIRDVLDWYFNAVDAKDEAGITGCFAEDAKATYQAGTPFERATNSGRQIVGELMAAIAKYKSSIHATSSVSIQLAGQAADTRTFAVAYLYLADKVVVRGLRYDDHLVKRTGRWVILARRHAPLWQYEATAVPLIPAGRTRRDA